MRKKEDRALGDSDRPTDVPFGDDSRGKTFFGRRNSTPKENGRRNDKMNGRRFGTKKPKKNHD